MTDNQALVDKKYIPLYIPLDKSWVIRMGILDMVNGCDDIQKFLSAQESLGDDLIALKRAAEVWNTGEPVDVGESGTLYRLLKFASWKLGLNKQFIKRGTLLGRKINDDPAVVNLPQQELLKLDNGTSQWASAAVLLGDPERLAHAPFKLQLTYDAVSYWKEMRKNSEVWQPRYDETIHKQAEVYLEMLKGDVKPTFALEQAEDFCFAYIFGYMSAQEGEKRWPALRGHESDRIAEVEEVLRAATAGGDITSKDHRVVQAIAMWSRVNKKPVNILYPEAVNKSWPQFWSFIDAADKNQ